MTEPKLPESIEKALAPIVEKANTAAMIAQVHGMNPFDGTDYLDKLRRAIAAALLRAGADGWQAASVLLTGTPRQYLIRAYKENERELRAQADALEGKDHG